MSQGLRSRLRSELPVTLETKKLMNKIKGLFAQKSSRLVIAKGTFRENAENLRDVLLDETLAHNNIQFSRSKTYIGKEATQITALADDGALEATSVTAVADVAGSLNSKYFLFSDALDAHKYYVWFNINSAGVDPAVATRTGIQVTGATGVTAATLGAAIRAAISGSAANTYVTVGGSGANVTITNRKLGNSTDAVDGGAPTGFAITVTTQGHASTRQSTFFTLHAALNASKHYVWLNVNSEGIDPTPAGYTAIPVAITAGASAAAVATAIASAVDANAAYVVAAPAAATMVVVNAAIGYADDTADGSAPTGFAIAKLSEEECYDLSDIQIIKRLRTKKYLIRIKADANPAKL